MTYGQAHIGFHLIRSFYSFKCVDRPLCVISYSFLIRVEFASKSWFTLTGTGTFDRAAAVILVSSSIFCQAICSEMLAFFGEREPRLVSISVLFSITFHWYCNLLIVLSLQCHIWKRFVWFRVLQTQNHSKLFKTNIHSDLIAACACLFSRSSFRLIYIRASLLFFS